MPQQAEPKEKRRGDPRHQRRARLMQQLYAEHFFRVAQRQALSPLDAARTESGLEPEEQAEIDALLKMSEELDALITSAAPDRPLREVNQVDLAIIRLILYESKVKDTPVKVLIDEGVELAKAYGAENSPKFVNGVLHTILRGKKAGSEEADSPDRKEEEETKEDHAD